MSSYVDTVSQAKTASAGSSTILNKNEAMMGKEDFLMLLVAQLQNQDPLNPDEPTEFTAQLAQFSSLEQLFTLNESMENMARSNANSDRFSTLNTIGKEVVYNDDSFKFNGEAVNIGYELDGNASEVTISIKQDGATIATIDADQLGSGRHFISWDGMKTDGSEAPHGEYEITLHAKATAGESVGIAPLIQSEVTGVDLDGSYGGILITKAGEVAFNTILEVYEATGQNETITADGS